MEEIKIIELKESILEDNNKDAELLRNQNKERGIFLINLMSSPGSGKTTTLLKLAEKLKSKANFSVMEADIDSDTDAKTIAEAGTKCVQLHTGGMCHLDADMTRQGLAALGAKNSIVVLENIGNLVCPAEYDTGANKKITILSVTEGDDKPAKYPLMFSVSDLVVINKMDAISYFDFNADKCVERIKKLNPEAKIIFASAKTGEGIDELANWILSEYEKWRLDNGRN